MAVDAGELLASSDMDVRARVILPDPLALEVTLPPGSDRVLASAESVRDDDTSDREIDSLDRRPSLVKARTDLDPVSTGSARLPASTATASGAGGHRHRRRYELGSSIDEKGDISGEWRQGFYE